MLNYVLRRVASFDSNSAFLGVVRADGTVSAVDRAGRPVADEVAVALRPLVSGPGTGIAIRQLIQLPHSPDWYLPVTLRVPREARLFS